MYIALLVIKQVILNLDIMKFTDLMEKGIGFSAFMIKTAGKTIKETTENNMKKIVVIYKNRKIELFEVDGKVEKIVYGNQKYLA